MKALRLTRETAGSPTVVSLVELPKPALIPNHVLIKVHASAIHPSDVLNAHGGFPFTTFPRVPGRDYAGTIVEGPADRIGEEVYGTSGFTHAFTVDGFHAEYCLVSEDAVAPKPKNLSFVQAACVGVPFTTGSLVLRRVNTSPTDVVLVTGASGAVGSATVQLAKSKGSRVITATRSDSDDINTSKDPELTGVNALTQGRGVDVIVDTVGQPALVQAAVAKLAQGGRLSFIAAPRSGSTELIVDMKEFYREERILVGCNSLKYSAAQMAKELAAISPSFEKGLLKAAGAGEWTEMKLEDGVEAYEKASTRGAGKFVIVMG